MPIDTERNRVLASLRDQLESTDSSVLSERLTLAGEVVERHLLYCADYDLAKWPVARLTHGSVHGRSPWTSSSEIALNTQGAGRFFSFEEPTKCRGNCR